MYSIRIQTNRGDGLTNEIRYMIVEDGEYRGDYPTLQAAREAIRRLTQPEPKQNPWRTS